MSIRPLISTAIVGLPAGLLVILGDGGLVRTPAIAAGAALVAFACVRLARRTGRQPAPASTQARQRRWRTEEELRLPRAERIDRTPAGRGPRDLRCPASRRARARARRSR